MPIILTPPSGPYPKEERVPSNNHNHTNDNTVDFFLPQPSSSSKVETALSVSAIELVIAANSTKKEKDNTDSCSKSHTGKYLWNGDKHQVQDRLAAYPDLHLRKQTQQE